MFEESITKARKDFEWVIGSEEVRVDNCLWRVQGEQILQAGSIL